MISLDPRGAGLSDKPDGTYSTELFADDVADFMHVLGIESAHVGGVSLGGAVGLWLASKYPERVKTLSLHSSWPKSDPFLKAGVQIWRTMAKGLDSVPEMIIQDTPLLPHARVLRREIRRCRSTRRLRAFSSRAAARRLHAPVERSDRA